VYFCYPVTFLATCKDPEQIYYVRRLLWQTCLDTIVLTLHRMIESGKNTCTYPERTRMCPEHFLRCNDCSIKAGGWQLYHPLNIVQGLSQMAIHLYTDDDWDSTLPHVSLTSALDWDPGQIDHTLDDDDQWYDTISDLPPDPITTLYHEFGDHHHVEVQTTTVTPSLDAIIDCCTYAVLNLDTHL